MFCCCGAIVLDLTSFDTSKVEDMAAMFGTCESLTTIYVGDTFVLDPEGFYSDMFSRCPNLVGGNGRDGGNGGNYGGAASASSASAASASDIPDDIPDGEIDLSEVPF